MTLGSLSRALLRANYDIAHLPFQLVEDVGMSRLDDVEDSQAGSSAPACSATM
ncbi:hypothetical protein [Rhodococcus koreensis]|uniref:hypothetical protein n=1 Tax=Rhodococcus koreensis TaxID=99653 RepID=UPI000AF0357B|nr:hypothetical protein [Rhodococcus koreensis]